MKKIKLKIIFNLIAAVSIIAIIVLFTIKYVPDITRLVKNPEDFRRLILSYDYLSIFIFILFQFIQVVIAAIPGEAVQISGGYMFGAVFGTAYSIIGILAGSIMAFFMARVIGLPLVKYFVPEGKFKKLAYYINSQKSELAIFIIFLIPGMPKDILVYAAGVTPISPLKFIIINMIARLPGIIGSSIIGANIFQRNYTIVIIISIISIILFTAGVFFKEKIFHMFHIILKNTNSSE